METYGRGKRLSKTAIEKRIHLHSLGLSDREVALKLGVTSNAICLWRKRNGLKANFKNKDWNRPKGVTLCLTCRQAVATVCPFFTEKDLEVGLKAVGAKAEKHYNCGGKTYIVRECPQYKQGSLPPVGWREVQQNC